MTAEKERAWDDYVSRHAHGSPFHLIAWKKTIEETFGYAPQYLLVSDENGIRGVLPLFLVRNRILGTVLISSPFAVYGGILADSDYARRRLYDAATELAVAAGAEYIEYRNAEPEQCVGVPNVHRYFGFTQKLTADEDALMASLPKKTRNIVRKTLKQPFSIRSGVQDPRTFWKLLSVSYRRLGTPIFPRDYFDRLLKYFGNLIDMREVWLGDEPAAVCLTFVFRGQMHIYYAAADTRLNAFAPNMRMYYDLLSSAGRDGLATFDFGRSKQGTGAFEFKRHWATEMRELPYEIVLIRRRELPNVSPSNPKFSLAVRLWQRLPLWVAERLGPRIIRMFP